MSLGVVPFGRVLITQLNCEHPRRAEPVSYCPLHWPTRTLYTVGASDNFPHTEVKEAQCPRNAGEAEVTCGPSELTVPKGTAEGTPGCETTSEVASFL